MTTNTGPDLLTVPEAAQMLRLKDSTVRAWLLQRRIRFVKLGRRVFLKRGDVQALVETCMVPAEKSQANSPNTMRTGNLGVSTL
jgi:excisionase family DNA binding protein